MEEAVIELMKLYFQQDGIELWHGKCQQLPHKNAADLVLADPPYGETSLAWDRWPDGWVRDAERWLKPTGSLWCFGSLRMFLDHSDDFAALKHAQEIVWEKHNGSGFHADRFKRVHELAVQFYCGDWADVYKSPVFTRDATKRTVRRKTRPTHTGHIENAAYESRDGGPRLMRSVLSVRSCHGYAIHPTQKPLGILSPLISYSCPPGGLVIVPFAGSGSELEAARLAGCRAIGVEARKEYCEAAARRLSQQVLNFSALAAPSPPPAAP